MKRHHWLIIAAASLFVGGWLVWNMLLVDSDLSGPPMNTPPPAPSQ